MSIQSEINARTAKLQVILAGANNSIKARNGKEAADLNGIPAAIDAIPSDDPVLQVKSVYPTGEVISVTPDEGYDGLSAVNVAGDAFLVPENIAKDVTIYGVTGTHEGGEAELQDKLITENGVYTADNGYDGLGVVTVAVEGSTEFVTTAIDYSAWDNGVFKETLDSGDTLTYSVEFNADGQPNKITAPDGTVTWIEWGEG